MPAKSLQDVRDRIEVEGFDYAFRFYSGFEEVDDAEFHKLRTAFIAAADALEEYVNERSVGEIDDGYGEEEEEDEEDEPEEDESDLLR